MHSDWIEIIESTKTKTISLEDLFNVVREEDCHGMSKEEIPDDKIRARFSCILDNFQDGDEIWQWDNIRPLSGQRGYALYRGNQPIEMVVTNMS
jgi:hypothetical protein